MRRRPFNELTAKELRAARACVHPNTLEAWPRQRLDLLWRLWSRGVKPMAIARELTVAHPDLPPLQGCDISWFARQRGVPRGSPVPDPTFRFDCYLYRDLPDEPPAEALVSDDPAGNRRSLFVEDAALPWADIDDWAARQNLRRPRGASAGAWLAAVNRARGRHGLPPFRPVDVPLWSQAPAARAGVIARG